MSYRHLMISSPGKLSTRENQLVITTEQGQNRVPIEDINSLLIENPMVTLTGGLLTKLAEAGVLVFVCDQHHLPSGVFTPFNGHSRQLQVLHKQLHQSKPYLKQLWQQIVVSKLTNQGHCLRISGKDDGKMLYQLCKEVRSGDSTNVEATGAMLYFVTLFGQGFVRRTEGLNNSALNYGYAIIRGVVAKNLAVYGFLPALGIHHHNNQNPFNLADDLMEPFRPLVDLYVVEALSEEDQSRPLAPKDKQGLYNLLNMTINSQGEQHSVQYAIERMVKSLSTCFSQGSGGLILPELIPLAAHRYE